MPTPLTYQKIQGASGTILIPIYNVGDLADSSFRVMTSKGLGAYELVALSPSLPIRVMTPTGPKSINTVVGVTTPNPNLLLYSEDFSQTAWLKGASTTAVANNVAMPIGTGTYLSQMKTVEVGKTYTFTVWVQANAGDYSDFDIWAGRTDAFTIDYGNKVCTPTDTLTAHSFTFTATSTTCYVGFDNVNGQTSPNIVAKAKLEEGNASTSYIKTPGANILVLSDTFTRANSTTSLGVADTGQTWQKYDFRSAVYGISANQAYPAVIGWDYPAFVDIGISDNYDYSLKLAVVGSGNQIMWRIAGDLNYLVISGTNIRRVVSNTWTTIGTIPTLVSGDVVKIQVRGNVHTIFVNGVQRAEVTESAHATATKVGFSTNSTASRWDDVTVHKL